jgi:hypothetical protein
MVPAHTLRTVLADSGSPANSLLSQLIQSNTFVESLRRRGQNQNSVAPSLLLNGVRPNVADSTLVAAVVLTRIPWFSSSSLLVACDGRDLLPQLEAHFP